MSDSRAIPPPKATIDPRDHSESNMAILNRRIEDRDRRIAELEGRERALRVTIRAIIPCLTESVRAGNHAHKALEAALVSLDERSPEQRRRDNVKGARDVVAAAGGQRRSPDCTCTIVPSPTAVFSSEAVSPCEDGFAHEHVCPVAKRALLGAAPAQRPLEALHEEDLEEPPSGYGFIEPPGTAAGERR